MLLNNPNHSIFILVNTPFYPARRSSISFPYRRQHSGLLSPLPETIQLSRILCGFVDSASILRKRARSSYTGLLYPVTWLEDVKTRRWVRLFPGRCKCIYISDKDARPVARVKRMSSLMVLWRSGWMSQVLFLLNRPMSYFLEI